MLYSFTPKGLSVSSSNPNRSNRLGVTNELPKLNPKTILVILLAPETLTALLIVGWLQQLEPLTPERLELLVILKWSPLRLRLRSMDGITDLRV
ncbi:MAG: hypothetical protein PHT95_03215 [Candidatus Omnitrophica bacterium]|nr:hypothetical protein [Candidatus Omnitrophota bacterium]